MFFKNGRNISVVPYQSKTNWAYNGRIN
jgi:hypothetical protein